MTDYIKRVFGLDLRSLALFRIMLGVLLMVDTSMRIGDLKAHYSDQGVLPRNVLIDPTSNLLSDFSVSLYFISGSTPFVLVLMLLQIVIGALLIVGFKTRLMTVCAWLLVISLHARNPMVITGGDSLLSLLLLWSIFLPLGARYSIDKALNKETYSTPNHIFSVATLGIIVQIICVYIFNWFNKLDPVWILDHTALYYALNADLFVTHLGKVLRNFVGMTQFLTMTVHMFQLIGRVLLLLPFWNQTARIVVITFFIAFHVGIALTLNIGYFPYVSIVSWIILIPSVVWLWVDKRRLKRREPFIMYYDGGCDFCVKTVLMFKTFLFLDFAPMKEVQSDKEIKAVFEENNTWVIRRHNKGLITKWDAVIYAFEQSYYLSWFATILRIPPLSRLGDKLYEHISQHRSSYSKFTSKLRFNDYKVSLGILPSGVAAVVLMMVVYWNLSNVRQLDISRPNFISHIGATTRISQKWSMFAPHPIRTDGWLVAPGTLTDGSVVDVRSKVAVEWDKPKHVAESYDNNRWRKYLVNLKKDKQFERRIFYGKYICREWYDGAIVNGVSLKRFELYFMKETTRPPGLAPVMGTELLWSHECLSD